MTDENINKLVKPVFKLLEKASFTGEKIIELIFHKTTIGIRYEEFLHQAIPLFEKLADNEGLRQNLKQHLFKKNENGVCFACVDNFLKDALPLFTKLKLNYTELSNAFSKTSFINFLAENHKNNKLENVIPFIKTISSQNLLRLLLKEMSSVSRDMLNTISIFENKFITFDNRDQLIAFLSDYLEPNHLREFLSQNLLTATLQSGLLPKEILAKAYGVDYDPASIKENNNDLNTSISTWLKTKKDETELAKALALPYYLGLSDLFQEGYRKLSPTNQRILKTLLPEKFLIEMAAQPYSFNSDHFKETVNIKMVVPAPVDMKTITFIDQKPLENPEFYSFIAHFIHGFQEDIRKQNYFYDSIDMLKNMEENIRTNTFVYGLPKEDIEREKRNIKSSAVFSHMLLRHTSSVRKGAISKTK